MTTTARQTHAADAFRALHAEPFLMPNAWDGASAAQLAIAKVKAVGTTSFALAFAHGRLDGIAAVSRELAIANAAIIAEVSQVPVNGDLEDGYGASPEACVATVEAAIGAGLAGLGIEDTTADRSQPIHDFDSAVRRIQAAARAADGRIVLTARADGLLHKNGDVDDIVRRLCAFAEAGADVVYAPGLATPDDIRRVARAVAPKPLNVLFSPALGQASLADYAALGATRVSLGGMLFAQGLTDLQRHVALIAAGDLNALRPDGAARAVGIYLAASNQSVDR
jgi:2-methylisocitrate lyase-like PEP mutase family enzyme